MEAIQAGGRWRAALCSVVLLQTMSAFAFFLLPTVAPVLVERAGIPEASIGYLTALSWTGAMAFLIVGEPLMRRLGSIRTMQAGAFAIALGIAIMLVPCVASLALASFLIGVGYSPGAPAGSDVLQRHAPAKHRSLMFSIKQAGVPLGGILAALVLPPLVAVDWRAMVGISVLILLVPPMMVQPLRSALDAPRDRTQPVGLSTLISRANLMAPLRAVRLAPEYPSLLYTGFCLAAAQGATFSFLVTYLVADNGFDLRTAAFAFAAMQATGIAGRIGLGWITDRIGSARRVLTALSLSSGVTIAILSSVASTWPSAAIFAIAAVGGIAVSSWNGVILAEIARLAPSNLVREATSGATLVIFTGYVIGPSLFALLLGITGRYDVAFGAVAAIALTALMALTRPFTSSSEAVKLHSPKASDSGMDHARRSRQLPE